MCSTSLVKELYETDHDWNWMENSLKSHPLFAYFNNLSDKTIGPTVLKLELKAW